MVREWEQASSGCAVTRQDTSKLLWAPLLMGCVFLVIGCSGVRSEAPQEEQRHTEATMQGQELTEATGAQARSDRCEGTRTFKKRGLGVLTTNDVPGCPNGGLLLGTHNPDQLDGKDGKDEIRGLGASDFISGGAGNDVVYGGPGNDGLLVGGEGEDVVYSGPGDDNIVNTSDGERDRIYCGEGKDEYLASKSDYVSSSCEEKMRFGSL